MTFPFRPEPRTEPRDSADFQTYMRAVERQALPVQAKAAAALIYDRGMNVIVGDILNGDGGANDDGHVGFTVPDPVEPLPYDGRGVEFFFADLTPIYMDRPTFQAFLSTLNAALPPAKRADAAAMARLPEALRASGLR